LEDTRQGSQVPPEGPVPAPIMLIGQNPGREEVKQGRSFVGRSGRYLDRVLGANNLDRSSMYITSVVKEGTPKNRKPNREEIDRWMPSLVEEIKKVKPCIIVLMGKVAEQTPRMEGIKYMETTHPAAAMRFPGARRKFEQDFRNLAQMAGEL